MQQLLAGLFGGFSTIPITEIELDLISSLASLVNIDVSESLRNGLGAILCAAQVIPLEIIGMITPPTLAEKVIDYLNERKLLKVLDKYDL